MTRETRNAGRGLTTSSFIDVRARSDFWLFAAATFSLFTTNSMLALLSVVLKSKGLPAEDIGIVLSAPALPILVTMLLAGPVISRFGTLQVARAGTAIILAAYLSFTFTIDSFAGAIASRVAHGVGYALFMPAAMIYTDGRLALHRKIYYFGIYSSMFPLPNVIGPPLAEAYLRLFGTDRFFWYTALPALLGTVLVYALKPAARTSVRQASLFEYVHLLRHRGLWVPYGGVFFVGMFFGFVVSFMALLLQSRHTPVSYFFVSFTVCLFASRFLLLRYVQQLSRAALFTGGLALLSLSYLLLGLIVRPPAAILAGVLFGLGYSVAYPTLSVWVAQQFPADKQGMPLTLYNALFTLGIFLLPLLGGYVIARLGAQRMVIGMALGGFVVIALLWLAYRPQRRS
jgi:predicted MFS family arabinose efflux permease